MIKKKKQTVITSKVSRWLCLLQTLCQFELDLCLAHVTDNDDAQIVMHVPSLVNRPAP